MNGEKFGRFAEFMGALKIGAKRLRGEMAEWSKLIYETVHSDGSQFFFAANPFVALSGKDIAPVADLIRMPYPTLVLMFEASPTIELYLFAVDTSDTGGVFSFMSIACHERKKWQIAPWAVECSIVDGGLSMFTKLLDISEKQFAERNKKTIDNECIALANLCVMLNTTNTRAKMIAPPASLVKARARRGKPPLYSYHVLVVDGAELDEHAYADGSESRFYRSHLRRGHIRRLESGPTFVRACMVRGRVDGFVDKEYRVQASQ
jgi:hypothetical protein